MSNVIFICTANICRSPMAEKFFLQKLEQYGLVGDHNVSSAGTWTKDGFPADPVVARILEDKYNLSLKNHQSQEISKALIADKNIILVMEKNHREALQIEFSEKYDQIFLLSEMVGQEFDITDPHRLSEQEYEMTVQQIHQIIEYGFDEILKRAAQQ